MDKFTVNLYDMLLCLSNAVDLVTPEVSSHHQQVAYLAFRIAEQLKLPEQEQRDILIAGTLHDIGALSVNERLAAIEEEPPTINSHAFRGARLLEEAELFGAVPEIVRYHHIPWEHGNGKRFRGKDVPMASHLLHLADRACVMIRQKEDILAQVPNILLHIRSKAGELFMPGLVEALMELARVEHIWLSLVYKSPTSYVPSLFERGTARLGLDELIRLSGMFSRIIDFRSHFTATHSAGVARMAEKIGELAGFSGDETRMLLIAGYLHDLGKLAIPSAVLEKPSALNEREYNLIKGHTFFTYQLLDTIRGFETINRWASYHHEKLNGSGYPFHLKGGGIPLGSRVMAVADIFTALAEDRPYRKGMGRDQIIRVLQSMVKDGFICREIVHIALKNFDLLTELCNSSQCQAESDYNQFFNDDMVIA